MYLIMVAITLSLLFFYSYFKDGYYKNLSKEKDKAERMAIASFFFFSLAMLCPLVYIFTYQG